MDIGNKISIGNYLYLSRAEDSTGGRKKASIIEDAVEALIAALGDAGQEVDEEIISKLTGKASQYFTKVITAINEG